MDGRVPLTWEEYTRRARMLRDVLAPRVLGQVVPDGVCAVCGRPARLVAREILAPLIESCAPDAVRLWRRWAVLLESDHSCRGEMLREDEVYILRNLEEFVPPAELERIFGRWFDDDAPGLQQSVAGSVRRR